MAKKLVVVASRKVVLREENGYRVAPAAVVVKGGTIEAVRELSEGNYRSELLAIADELRADVKDFGSKLISPAFVNPHTHVTMSYFRGFSIPETTKRNMIEDLFFHVESRITAADVRAFTRMGAFESLLNGVGFVWDHYYFGESMARAFSDVGMTGVVCPALQDLAGPGVAWLDRQWNETVAVAESSRFRASGIFAGVGVHATDTCSTRLWKRAVAEARRLDLPIHAHVAQSFEEYKKVQEREGKSPAEFLDELGLFESGVPLLAVHGIHLSRSDLALMKRGRVALCFCPFSQLVFNFPADVLAWDEAGLPWGVATDCVASNDSMNVQKELRFVAGIPNGVVTRSDAHQDFLAHGGIERARRVSRTRSDLQDLAMRFSSDSFLLEKSWEISPALGVRVGRLERGYLANLVVWDTEHPSFWPGTQPLRCLSMADTSGAIHNMMVNGAWMGRDGDFHRSLLSSHGYREAMTEARERLKALQARL